MGHARAASCCTTVTSCSSCSSCECDDACLAATFSCFDKCIRIVEPALAVLATVLVLVDAGVFFQHVMPRASGPKLLLALTRASCSAPPWLTARAAALPCDHAQVLEQKGTHTAVLHACIALWLLFNVLWNQAYCTLTRPGSTLEADAHVRTLEPTGREQRSGCQDFPHAVRFTTWGVGRVSACAAQELQAAMTHEWRWCTKCKRGKPPLSHHCSVCQK